MALKEFTINVDVAVFAKNRPCMIRKLGTRLHKGGFNYWMGDITEEVKKGKKQL